MYSGVINLAKFSRNSIIDSFFSPFSMLQNIEIEFAFEMEID